MIKEVRIDRLFSDIPEYLLPLFSECVYPWEVVSKIGEYVKSLTSEIKEGYYKYKEGVIVHESVKIYPTATLEGIVFLGAGCEVRPGAFIRGNLITGRGCVIGNSTEIKNSVLLDRANVPHYNYVGDSILGAGAHMGASSICSNLKSDGKAVVVHGKTEYNTGMRKLGAILADGADVGCGTILNPGCVIGKGTRVYPNLAIRGVFPQGVIVKSQTDISEIV